MDKDKIVKILESYRPGEKLESDPDVVRALELASSDPELVDLRREIEEFDRAFSAKIRQLPVPSGLYRQILDTAQEKQRFQAEDAGSQRKVIRWLHPAFFAAAAGLVILLALSFTYWNPPVEPEASVALNTDDELMQTADSLYASLRPSFRSREGGQILEYLRNRDAAIPASMPTGFAWDRSFACDVMEVDGKKVSLICFKGSEDQGTFHLFTFDREDFPQQRLPQIPELWSSEGPAKASWAESNMIHVLYSDDGEENLRSLLDI